MSATGVVTSVSAGSLVIQGSGERSLTFVVDVATRVLARGRGVRLVPLRLGGAAGLTITDVVHSGDRVTVKFQNSGTALKAIEVRVVSK